jgi:hypothetical protein
VQLHSFDLGCTCFSRYEANKGFVSDVWFDWHNTKKLNEYIQSLAVDKTSLYLFGHNIFFDLQVSDFFHYFTKWGWILEFLYDKGTTYILIISKGNCRIKCISTTNYFPVPLAVLGKFLGIPKLKVVFGNCLRSELLRYCRNDTFIIRKAIEYYIKFIDLHDLGRFSLSRAAQSLNAYRYRFMDKAIYLHKDKIVQDLEMQAYSGGRVESRFLGTLPKDDYVSLDINSMYPYVMKKYKMPVKLLDYKTYLDIDDIPVILKHFTAVASVTISTDEPAYAVKYKGKLVFPTGNFKTYLCSAGLAYAYKHNHLRSVDEIAIYQKAFIFKRYVDYFMKLKEKYSKQNNDFMKQVSKYFLLYLYGKFAQQKDIVTEQSDITYDGYYREETFDLVTLKTEVITKLFNKKWSTFGREATNNCFTAIAAHVTEYARFRLYELMQIVGLNKVIYCDTDSLKLRQIDAKPLAAYLDNHKLGMLKVEETFKQFTINGAKNYQTEKVKRIKGIPSQAKQIEQYKYTYLEFKKQASHLAAQVTRYAIVQPKIKVVKPYYDKGKVLKDGTIIPFVLNEF